MKLSIIIVHYKTPQLLLECVRSIYSNSVDFDYEVIVVDNNSQDNSEKTITETFKSVKWINSKYNSGFARANNWGIKHAVGEYILLLNPDSYIKTDFLQKLTTHYTTLNATNKLGLLGCRIISSQNGNLLVGSGIGFPGIKKHIKANPIYIYLTRKYTLNKNAYNPDIMHYQNHEVDFVSGACVMIQKSKIKEHKLSLDNDFFLYYEDVEWSYRAKQRGLTNYFIADIEMYHVNSASTSTSSGKSKQILLSEFLYFYKTNHLISYHLLGLILRFNFFLTKQLLQRNNEQDKLLNLEQEEEIFLRYFYNIPKWYSKKASSGQQYLKYDP